MSAATYYTAEMVRALIREDRAWPRYETVHGELLVTPAPRIWHQRVVGRLFAALFDYARHELVGEVFMSPADISWSTDTLVQPDVFVVPTEEMPRAEWSEVSTLLLAIEVMSPSSVRADRFAKRRLYQEHGVLYWLLDIDTRLAEIWSPHDRFPRTAHDCLEWKPAGAATAFTLQLAELFRTP